MVCIVGINVFDYKYVVIGLIVIYGIGKICFKVILVVIGIVEIIKIGEFLDEIFDVLCEVVGKYIVEGDFCCEVILNIKCFMDFGCFCGLCYCCLLLFCG